MGAGQSSRHPLLSRLESGSMSSAVFRMVSVANKKNKHDPDLQFKCHLDFLETNAFPQNTVKHWTRKKQWKELRAWKKGSDGFRQPILFFRKNKQICSWYYMRLFDFVLHSNQCGWVLGCVGFVPSACFGPNDRGWLPSFSVVVLGQSFHVNRVIRNPASISLPVPPCSAAATPEPVLIELHHLGVTHGCHLQKISPGRAHLWFFNVLYVYAVYYT